MSRGLRIAVVGAVGAVVAFWGAGVITHQGTHADGATTSQRGSVVIAHGADRLPDRTASDWVTYADHVVTVTPLSQVPIKPPPEALERGEGMILRRLTLRVDEVLWSNAGVKKAAPKKLPWVAYGWHFTGGNTSNRVKMASADAPRIEAGHRYIMAINWQPARCTTGDFVPAQWGGLGSDSILPFDRHVIGLGESEGQRQTLAQATAGVPAIAPNRSLEDELVGESADALVQALESADPASKRQDDPPALRTPCR